jgi:hypothetical protein
MNTSTDMGTSTNFRTTEGSGAAYGPVKSDSRINKTLAYRPEMA